MRMQQGTQTCMHLELRTGEEHVDMSFIQPLLRSYLSRMGYYKDVARNTNMYAFGMENRGGTRRHVFCPTTVEELLVWDGIVRRNINTNIAESWVMNQSNIFDQEIMEAMHFRRWLDIKAC
jgi:hypothetical protein